MVDVVDGFCVDGEEDEEEGRADDEEQMAASPDDDDDDDDDDVTGGQNEEEPMASCLMEEDFTNSATDLASLGKLTLHACMHTCVLLYCYTCEDPMSSL